MRNQHNDVGDELKAVAQDMLALGARAMRTGRDWLSDWRNDMSDRNRGPQSHAQGSGREGYQSDQGGPWRGHGQGHAEQPHTHRPDYYASQDYGRGQAYGEDGLHAEYGSYGGSYREYGQAEDNRFGQRGQTGQSGQSGRERASWLDQQGGQSRGQSQWSRGGHSAGSGSYAQPQSGRGAGRRPGTGYGSSSSYGDPDQYSYAGDYDEPSFVSPADTQFRGGQSGRQYGSGRYSGMGPRNYTRPDARINEDLCERLTHDPDIDASDIEVRVSGGEVTLAGTVEHRWMKHRAEDLADSCSGVRHVENNIRVRSQQSSQGAGSGRDSHEGSRHTGASGGSQTGSPSTPTSRSAGSQAGNPGSGSGGSAGGSSTSGGATGASSGSQGSGAGSSSGSGGSPGSSTSGSSTSGGSTPGNSNR